MTHYSDASVLGLTFRKSSYSNGQENCVEYAVQSAASAAVVRDSKDPHGPALVFAAGAFASFVAGIKAGEFGTV
ncbi:hypothetical protein P3T37_000533 [Kitasatospora sp. MAA4]|uniref:DUF397 domain-containing protein n=1 Tax=Kitasatospora sp. MAA4 TaxID=3035093 RepID=UPI00247403D0|nr:DUF397 domain-containing protein [Kitasatospora sp. MAA4]MDH6131164.1 hypothetical protein [Kitasatospora sp. MAA4]